MGAGERTLDRARARWEKKQKLTKLYSWNSDRTAIVIVQFFFRWDNLALACVHKYPLVASGALGDQMQGDVPCTLLTHGLSTEHIILCEEMGMLVGLGDVDPGPLAAYIVATPGDTMSFDFGERYKVYL